MNNENGSIKDKFREKSEARKKKQKKYAIIGGIAGAVMLVLAIFTFYGDVLMPMISPPPVDARAERQRVEEEAKQKAIDEAAAKAEAEQKAADWAQKRREGFANGDPAKYRLVMDKSDYKLYLYEKGIEEPIKVYSIAVGKNPGQKEKEGDMKTPTGDFKVEEIFASQSWTHDFGDGKGEIKGAYGPYFISLKTDWDGIGIHGTHAPESIGTMASEGCVRMTNSDLEDLMAFIRIGMDVKFQE